MAKQPVKNITEPMRTVANDSNVLNELLDRITKLEKQNTVIRDAFQFVSDELRPMYGLAHVANIFDAIVKRLDK